jgi:HTH-type transcriptional regulator / antitoxin HigA
MGMDNHQDNLGDVLRQHLAAKGWGQADLAQIIGKTTAAVNEIIQGRRTISPEVATLFGAAFGTSAEFWLSLDAVRRVSAESVDLAKARARLYSIAPVREMVRRGWISKQDSLPELEAELKAFVGTETLDVPPPITVATRRSEPQEEMNPSQRAWCFRARNLAADLIVPPFDAGRLPECEARLQELLAFAPRTREVPKTLHEFGIRFVVVQHLSDSKIDGAALWIDEQKPVIAMSLRMDRIDSFWFTLLHEFSHIRHGDASVDSNLTGEDAVFSAAKPEFERRADQEAAGSLIPQDKLRSFVNRLAPYYSKERINQFAHRIKVHPGVIVGQLQHLGEIKYRANREMLVRVRNKVIATSVVDGWGNSNS